MAKREKKVDNKPYPAGLSMPLKAFVAEHYLKGYTYRVMAQVAGKKFGRSITITTINNYVKKLVEEWKQERVEKLDALKSIELQRINRLETTYWQAWEKSLEEAKRTTELQELQKAQGRRKEGMKTAELRVTSEDSQGDPRFLAGIQWCIQMRCRILGVEAPTEIRSEMNAEITRKLVIQTKTRNSKKPNSEFSIDGPKPDTSFER